MNSGMQPAWMRTKRSGFYRFKVTEEPICLETLPGDLDGDCVVDEHDLQIVADNLGNTAPTWPAYYDHDGN